MGADLDPPPAGPAPAPKQDPERLVLRGRPRPVVRFRRGLIILLAAGTALTVGALTLLALRPAGLRLSSEDDEPAMSLSGRTPEALADAPAGYGDVPKLGPPLPGDLGRPILEHERAMARTTSVTADPLPASAEAERLREATAARASAVLVQLSRRPELPATDTPTAASKPADEPGPASAKAAFARAAPGDRNLAGLIDPPSPWTLSAGTIVPASLLTGLNSDLPGLVVAQVTEAVRDSATGRTILIPQGARLIGQYDSDTAYGQRRALLVWQRIVFPNGASIALDHMPATDAGGYAGVEDKVDFHTLRLVEGIALASLLGVGPELVRRQDGGLLGAIRGSIADNGNRAGDQLTRRNLEVQPTLEVRPGWPIRAIVNKDLVLSPWKEQ